MKQRGQSNSAPGGGGFGNFQGNRGGGGYQNRSYGNSYGNSYERSYNNNRGYGNSSRNFDGSGSQGHSVNNSNPFSTFSMSNLPDSGDTTAAGSQQEDTKTTQSEGKFAGPSPAEIARRQDLT